MSLQVVEGAEKVDPSAVADSGGSYVARRIGEVRGCDLRFRSYATAANIDALSRKFNLVRSNRALGASVHLPG